MIKLKGVIQDYAWGKGSESIIHQEFGLSHQSERYAELWFGSHPNGDSFINDSKTTLSQYLIDNPNFLGNKVNENFGQTLPFLFKILSVGQALSIQLHPNLPEAQKLHQEDPEHYPDPFPKPEAGVAITPVKILYGYRPLSEIEKFLDKSNPNFCPELEQINQQAELNYKNLTKKLLSLDSEVIKNLCSNLWERLQAKSQLEEYEQEILKLQKLYPEGDRGVFFFYLLNFVVVKPGEALFIDANIMHAYLEGELVEIMAPSNNLSLIHI